MAYWPKTSKRLSLYKEFTKFFYSDNAPKILTNFKKTFLRNGPRDFIRFLNKSIVKQLREVLQENKKRDIKCQDEIHQVFWKRNWINLRRAISSCRKQIAFIFISTPSIINSWKLKGQWIPIKEWSILVDFISRFVV